jgi:multidrug efflux pump subunit AcrB
MPRFAIANPYFILVACLIVMVVGISSVARMPVDLFPTIRLPQVVVATFYNGMPPEEIETEITGRFERFFTLGAGIDHMESRSLPGASVIKIYFQPGTDPDADVTEISNLAMANLRRLPPGTLPPVVLKFDASNLPVCLITLKGEGLSETQLRDVAQFTVRNQLATAPGASVPPPFGGKYRQIMVYVDPQKLQANQMSLMDVVRAINNANLILPAGDVKIGPIDYNIYTNSQIRRIEDVNEVPVKTVASSSVTVGDIGHAEDAHGTQTNVVRVDGQRSVYIPVMKQGGDTNTIGVVAAVRDVVANLLDVPKQLVADVVFDQSDFVKKAIETLVHEGTIGLLLTGLMVLVFLANMRATAAVFLSIPLSALAALTALYFGGGSINSMVLAGLAVVFSRLIDNSVIVLENIFRHLELGEPAELAAERGGQEVAGAVLAATLTSAVVFFPVTFLAGVSRYLFSALALAVVLALFASYFVAMTVVPLFCAKLVRGHQGLKHDGADSPDATPAATPGSAPPGGPAAKSLAALFNTAFYRLFNWMLDWYEGTARRWLLRPGLVVGATLGAFLLSLGLYHFVGMAFFPRTDAGQFVINLQAPTGSRIEVTDDLVGDVEAMIRRVVPAGDLRRIVSNIGVTPGFSSIYTSNSGSSTATVLVALTEGHAVGSYEYMDRVRKSLAREFPQVTAFLQSGGLQDAILNQGLPAPIDVQVTGSNLEADYRVAVGLADRIRGVAGVSDVFIPQSMDSPALRLDVDRVRASQMGLSQREVIDNVITALTSNAMIAPSYWIDPKSGNDYMLTVQYPEKAIKSWQDLQGIPLRASNVKAPTVLNAVSTFARVQAPTEVDHYQIQRVVDVYVTPSGEDLAKVAGAVESVVAAAHLPEGVRVRLGGLVQGMRTSFRSFGFGLILALVLLFLILVAQFRSFLDPLLILLAVPPGVTGVLLLLFATGTTMNVQSLMGVVMMVGMVVSNSILIVEFAHRLEKEGYAVRDAVILSCRVRLRPILMTSLATVFGLVPMALKLSTGAEAYAPLARAIIGGLTCSVIVTVFLVPAAYLLVYGRRAVQAEAAGMEVSR